MPTTYTADPSIVDAWIERHNDGVLGFVRFHMI